jgi:glycosyltransferase involved in cell wall biosynthesis
MAACDLFVLNSTYEGLPHVLLEAANLGLPVVATSAGGTPEAMEHCEAGILVPPGNTEGLYRALKQMTAAGEVVGHGRKSAGNGTIEQFTPSRMFSKTEEALKEAVKGARLCELGTLRAGR